MTSNFSVTSVIDGFDDAGCIGVTKNPKIKMFYVDPKIASLRPFLACRGFKIIGRESFCRFGALSILVSWVIFNTFLPQPNLT